jgi:ZU5 domain
MIRSTLHRSISILVGAILISACSDSAFRNPVAPPAGALGQNVGSELKGNGSTGQDANQNTLELKALWWKNHHGEAVSVAKRIDASGGVISIPATGLTMVFPAGAVSEPTTIKVTSDDKYVAYKMEPSGIHFDRDVVVTQVLRFTEVAGAPLRTQLFAAYIADDNAKLSGKVPVLELEPSHTVFSALTGLPEAQVWLIRHFSRYMLASG